MNYRFRILKHLFKNDDEVSDVKKGNRIQIPKRGIPFLFLFCCILIKTHRIQSKNLDEESKGNFFEF